MFHVVVRSRGPLFVDWAEGAELWERLVAMIPQGVALVAVPDRVALVHRLPVVERLRDVVDGFRPHRRRGQALLGGLDGLSDPDVVDRTVDWMHLEPVRAGLTDDALSWPFSTLRDREGLAARPILEVAPRPEPAPTTVPLARLAEVVSAVFRVPLEELARPGAARTALVTLAPECCPAVTDAELVALCGVARGGPRSRSSGALRAVRAALSEPRMVGLAGPLGVPSDRRSGRDVAV